MYLIQKHSVQVRCQSKQLGHQFKEELDGLLQQEFYPKLESLLDRYDMSDQICEIATIPVAIQLDDVASWKQEIISKSIDQIALFLEAKSLHFSKNKKEERDKDGLIAVQSNKRYVQKLLLTYLVTASVPTNSLGYGLKEIYKEIVVDKQFVAELQHLCSTDCKIVLRWFLNIPQHIKRVVLKRSTEKSRKLKTAYIIASKAIRAQLKIKDVGVTKSVNEYLEFLFWNYVLQEHKTPNFSEITTIERITKEYFRIPESLFSAIAKIHEYKNLKEINFFEKYLVQVLEKVVKQQNRFVIDSSVLENFNALQKQQKSQDMKSIEEVQNDSILVPEQFTEVNESGTYIGNAGLVILHPFLVPLFDRLRYLENQQWKSKQLQHRAVLLTQHLVCLDQEVFESDLLLNKLLCGVPFKETIAAEWKITSEEREECRSLLTSVIEHWEILKNTSPEGLQHSFLQREGKLKKLKNGNYQLHVATTGIDVLLDQLPWGLGMFKKPWMDCFIDCIWN